MDSDIIPLTSPGWDAKNPSTSFRALVDSIHQPARQVFLQDRCHGEIKVSELREEDRKEGLMVSAQARDGYNSTWVAVIQRDKATNRVWLEPSILFTDTDGRFGKLFG